MTAIRTILLATTLLAGPAMAQEFRPAIVYSGGGKFDKSFNESAYMGAERFVAETGLTYVDFEPEGDAQIEQALRNYAGQGYSPIVAMSFAAEEAVEVVAEDYPDIQFVLIDGEVDLPNVRSVAFREHEGSFLAGLMAGMASQTGTVGFIGGMDIPLIRRFGCGYKQGVVAANPDATILESMTGTTDAAWSDPVRGGELARIQIDQGADVVYAAAGGTGLGVLQMAHDMGKLSVGVDTNQNYLHPGSVLTSMVKGVDEAVYDAFIDASQGAFTPGTLNLGVAENGVRVAMDENNAPLVTDEMKARLAAAEAAIKDGSLVVHDYMSDNSCPL